MKLKYLGELAGIVVGITARLALQVQCPVRIV